MDKKSNLQINKNKELAYKEIERVVNRAFEKVDSYIKKDAESSTKVSFVNPD